MKPFTPDQLRTAFLKFFESKGHTIVASDSLIPSYDPTLLYTGAGMNQFKDDFLGKGTRPYKRAATSQKCLRTQDLEVVGKTFFHHTFFEMLGNFSFGDYFKPEAIQWAWEFVTKVLELPPDRLHVSVYKTDDEAYNLWLKDVGVPAARIHRFGEKDNYWPANSPNDPAYLGPCGPCTEIFYDFGEQFGPKGEDPSGDSGRFCEIWNLVFQQYDKGPGTGPNSLKPLPKPGIDTGAGFERVLAVVNGKRSNFETDLFKPWIDLLANKAKIQYDFTHPKAPTIRRMADHARAAVFCIADGVWVGNTGRGYVLRKLIRRAVRDGRQLGIDGLFLLDLIKPVIDAYKTPYPELSERQAIVEKVIRTESEAFLKTLDKGEAKLQHFITHPSDEAWIAPYAANVALPAQPARKLAKLAKAGKLDLEQLPTPKPEAAPKGVLSGKVVFDLEQTFGFPGDVTKFILAEQGLKIDDIGYQYAEVKHLLVSGAGGPKGEVFDTHLDPVKQKFKTTEFTGYTHDSITLGPDDYVFLDDEGNVLDVLDQGQEAELYTRKTPFYAEQGGQLGDTGHVTVAGKTDTPAVVKITDTQLRGELRAHFVVVESGRLDLRGKKPPKITLLIDVPRREQIRKHHTATHLLHWALRKTLGDHVHQKGSLVAPDRLRFDFTHPEAIAPKQLETIEALSNEIVWRDDEVKTEISTPNEAKAKGAMALFGEKYGDQVRVVTVGPSIELCGGTHVRRAGEIGGVKIVSQASSSAGVRRIEAVCGAALLESLQADRRLIAELAEKLKSSPERLVEAVEKLQTQLKDARSDAKKAREQSTKSADPDLTLGTVKAFWLGTDMTGDALKSFVDQAVAAAGDAKCLVLAVGGSAFVAKASNAMTAAGVSVGDLVKKYGGPFGIRGGGSPQFVQGKAPDSKEKLLDFAKQVADLAK